MGRVMAVLNADMERDAVDRLTLSPGLRVLAVGFGPGVGVFHAANQVGGGTIAGIDPSSVMLAQARRRLMRAGKTADLRLGTASHLPWSDHSFDAVVTVNNIQLWSLPGDLEQVHRVLSPEGRLSVAVHASMLVRHFGATSPQDASQRLARIVTEAGFNVAGSELARSRTGPAIYILAAVA
jgi:ubiquinone/menaquinone biosynthesis C-methylase UbiE